MGNLSLGDMIRDIETNQAACFSLGIGDQMVGSRQEKPNFQDENWQMTWMMQGVPLVLGHLKIEMKLLP